MKRSLAVGDGFYIKGLHGALWDFTLQLRLAVQDRGGGRLERHHPYTATEAQSGCVLFEEWQVDGWNYGAQHLEAWSQR